MDGVLDTEVGYTGGTMPEPDYKSVCGGQTGHAEAVRVVYDPSKVDYEQLLKIFWENHDPTQVNRQGPDRGTQYRSMIFVHDEEQRAQAEASKKALDASGKYKKPIATGIEEAPTWWRAEEYHQQYYEKSRVGRLFGG